MVKISSSRNKIILLSIAFIIGGFSVFFMFLQFIAIGPGLPPSAGMPEWYLPDYDIKPENEVIIKDYNVTEHFALDGDRVMKCPSVFPLVSEYCGYANYVETDSDNQYLIISWYFDDGRKFLQGQKVLNQYLEERGNVSSTKLDISDELKRLGKEQGFASKPFECTGYESDSTSGYFLVYQHPFMVEKDDYFIVYYGLVGSAVRPDRIPFLKELVARSYYLNEPGVVSGLAS